MTTAANESTWVTLSAICDRLGKSPATVHRWIRLGMPKHQPAGKGGDLLFQPDEVDEWVKSRCSDLTPGEGAAA